MAGYFLLVAAWDMPPIAVAHHSPPKRLLRRNFKLMKWSSGNHWNLGISDVTSLHFDNLHYNCCKKDKCIYAGKCRHKVVVYRGCVISPVRNTLVTPSNMWRCISNNTSRTLRNYSQTARGQTLPHTISASSFPKIKSFVKVKVSILWQQPIELCKHFWYQRLQALC